MPRSTVLAALPFVALGWAAAPGCASIGSPHSAVAQDDSGTGTVETGSGNNEDDGSAALTSGSVAGQSSSGSTSSSSGGSSSGSSGSGPSGGSGSSSSGTGSSSGTSGDTSEGGATTRAGNPNGSCSAGVPALGKPADTSHPTTVVGTGPAATCTFSQLQAAVTKGGIVTFNCGSAPVTIRVTSTLSVPTDKNTVIDGGNVITLDGGSSVQILSFNSSNFQANDNRLTLQHITLTNGKMTPTKAIPTAPPPCSQGWDDGEGGALYMRDGNLTVIDATFTNNQAALLGPDTGGGAIYVLGSKHGALIVGSTFEGNTASNGGGVGGLFTELDIYNSLFTGNKAAGHDANNNEPSKCSVMNNGQNETGSGGNGGAMYSDGNSVNVTLCGDDIENNSAGTNAFGGGLFFTSNDMMGNLSITDTTMKGNTGGSWTNVSTGSVMNVGTAIGVNANSITVTSSMLQGVP
jgi:hypothetical protein